MQRTFDVRSVHEQFPALRRKHDGRSVAYFDGRLAGRKNGHRSDV